MHESALVQAHVDSGVKQRATAVLEELGMTVSDAVRILLTRTADEGALPFIQAGNAAAHDVWFCAKVQEAMDDSRPGVPHEEVQAHFQRRRSALHREAQEGQ